MQNNSFEQVLQDAYTYFEVPRWSRIFCAIYLSTVVFVGLPGNTLVIIVQSKLKQKSSTDWFVLGLALCDATSLLINLPVFFLGFTALWKFVATSVGCKLHSFIHFQTYLASAFFFALMAMDRYTKICHPHSRCFTPKRGKIASIVVLIVSCLLNVHHYTMSGLDVKGRCVFEINKTIISSVGYIVGSFIIGTATLFVSVAYFLVYRRMRRLRQTVPLESFPAHHRTRSTSILFKRNTMPLSLKTIDEEVVKGTVESSNNFVKERNETTKGMLTTNKVMTTNFFSSRINETNSNFKMKQMLDKENKRIENSCSTSRFISDNSMPTVHDSNSISASVNSTERHGNKYGRRCSVRNRDLKATKEGKQEPRMISTTYTMALASVLYVICTTVPSIVSSIWASSWETFSETETVTFLFLKLLYCINLFINPYFYIAMSSRFRKKASETIKGFC